MGLWSPVRTLTEPGHVDEVRAGEKLETAVVRKTGVGRWSGGQRGNRVESQELAAMLENEIG